MDDETLIRYEGDLERYWPDLKNSNFNESKMFWGTQWERHGICSRKTFANYLSLVFDDMKKHELHDVKQTLIAKDNIVPAAGKGYWVAGFSQAILNFENLITVVQCIKDGKKQYLYQITFCLTAQGQFMNCSENLIVDNCWIYGDTFMPLPPPSLMVSADKDETSDAAQNLLKGKDREVQSKE